jgi:hypothetical protein
MFGFRETTRPLKHQEFNKFLGFTNEDDSLTVVERQLLSFAFGES